jgi:hypothetical protein
VLSDQGYRTNQGVVINEFGATVERVLGLTAENHRHVIRISSTTRLTALPFTLLNNRYLLFLQVIGSAAVCSLCKFFFALFCRIRLWRVFKYWCNFQYLQQMAVSFYHCRTYDGLIKQSRTSVGLTSTCIVHCKHVQCHMDRSMIIKIA